MTRIKGGFTLIELLIAIVLMMIILASVTLIFMKTTDTVAYSEARTKVYLESRYALDTLEQERRCGRPAVPFVGGDAPPLPGAPLHLAQGWLPPPV